MTTTDLQVRIIMKELSKHGNQGRAAVKAGVCRQTAAKYIQVGKLSSELKKAHEWQTRKLQCFSLLLPYRCGGLAEGVLPVGDSTPQSHTCDGSQSQQ